MPKTVRKTKKKPHTSKPKAVPKGIPTVHQRLEIIARLLEMIGTGIGVDYDTFCSLDPKVEAVSLSATEVLILTNLISACYEQQYRLSEGLPADVLSALAPTHDQKENFEPLEVTVGGAR